MAGNAMAQPAVTLRFRGEYFASPADENVRRPKIGLRPV